MPRRSTLLDVPQAVRDDLNGRLLANGFSDYEALAAWLQAQGYEISKSALHRWGQTLENEFAGAMADARRAAELGRALAGDDDGSGLRRATTVMAQETLLRVLMGLRQAEHAAGLASDDGDGPDHTALAKSLSLVTRSLADLGRLSIADAKHTAAVKAQVAAEVADRAEAVGTRQGVSPEAIAALRAAILEGM
jgi:hypothetical protein